eukprot:SAG25_NODE_10655_length_326_cov_1.026432_1_plen_54_part_01
MRTAVVTGTRSTAVQLYSCTAQRTAAAMRGLPLIAHHVRYHVAHLPAAASTATA